jgi:LDH2 family malate/lactate/ureidoglycolate dehydrogenase
MARLNVSIPKSGTPAGAPAMRQSTEPILVPSSRLREFAERVFERLGFPPADARVAADVLIEADLRGFDCHGLSRLYPCYLRLRKGLIATTPSIQVEWLTPATGHCDGGNGLGMVVGWHAMQACIARAKDSGAAFLTVSRSNHFGIAGYYSCMPLEFDMIGIAMSNASPRVVPTGGTTGILGTNPISVAVPGQRGGGAPFILDMSTSAVSSGKIDVQLRKGKEIPDGWVYPSVKPFLDSEGVVPMSVLQYPLGGGVITGGHKGYGLALMVDILCGVLSGANSGSRLSASKRPDAEANIGHFFGAWQVQGFRSPAKVYEDLRALVEDMKSSPPEPGVEGVLVAGEPEMLKKERTLRHGVPVLPPVLSHLRQISSELQIPLAV